MPLEVEWIDDPERWTQFRDGWDELVERSCRPSIFSTWDFLEASWNHFARPAGNRLAVLAFHEGGSPLGFAPLRLSTRTRFGLPLRRLHLLAGWEADRVPFIFPRDREGEFAHRFVAFLEDRADDWDSMSLHEVSADSALPAVLHEWHSSRRDLRVVEQEDSGSPYITLDGGWEGFLSQLGARSRKNLKQCLRRLEKRGPEALEVFTEPAEMDDALDLYLDLEGRSWKPGEGQGLGRDRARLGFYRDLLRRLSGKGRASVSFLARGAKRIAGAVEYHLDGRTYLVHTTFDQNEARFSPGVAVRALCIQRCLQRGVHEYELQGGFLEQKIHWTRALHPRVEIHVVQLRHLRQRLVFGRSWLKSWADRRLAKGGSSSH